MLRDLFLFLATVAVLRAGEPALKWNVRLEPAAPAVGQTAELVLTAELPEHAIVYSSDFEADLGPQPTRLTWTAPRGWEPVGALRSVAAKRKRDRTWDVEFGYFQGRAELRQMVRVTAADFSLEGAVAGQLCDEKDGTCTLFEQPVKLNARS